MCTPESWEIFTKAKTPAGEDTALRLLARDTLALLPPTLGLGRLAGGFQELGKHQIRPRTITLAGRDVTRWPEHRRAAMIGRVFQNPFSGTAPNMTVAENLALAARRGQPRGLGALLPAKLHTELRDRVATLKMQLETRMNNPIGTLSGGQRQALTLLMATWRRPDLLLDEHTAALDPKSADQIVRLTQRIVSEHHRQNDPITLAEASKDLKKWLHMQDEMRDEMMASRLQSVRMHSRVR